MKLWQTNQPSDMRGHREVTPPTITFDLYLCLCIDLVDQFKEYLKHKNIKKEIKDQEVGISIKPIKSATKPHFW